MRLLMVLLCFAPGLASAQTTLEAAKGKVGIAEREGSSFSVDLNESKIGFLLLTSSPMARTWQQWELNVGLAATKNRRDILSGGEFNPELSVGTRWSHNWERSGAGYTAFYLAAEVSVGEGKFAQREAGVFTSLTEETQSEWGGAFGFNHAFDEDQVLGLALRGAHEWNSPPKPRTEEVCVQTGSGTNADGAPLVGLDCENRFIGAASDRWTGQLRLDYIRKIFPLADPDHPTTGILAAASLNWAGGRKPVYALAAGPTVHPPGFPTQLLLAVLAEVSDLTNVTDEEFAKRFFVRLYAKIPFDLL